MCWVPLDRGSILQVRGSLGTKIFSFLSSRVLSYQKSYSFLSILCKNQEWGTFLWEENILWAQSNLKWCVKYLRRTLGMPNFAGTGKFRDLILEKWAVCRIGGCSEMLASASLQWLGLWMHWGESAQLTDLGKIFLTWSKDANNFTELSKQFR